MFESFFAKLAGKTIANKLDLTEESKMDGTKKWFQSRTVWTGVVGGLLAIYGSLAPGLNLPHIPEWIFALLSGLGIYTRISATDKIV